MEMSSYDTYFPIIKDGDINFGITRLQTHNIFYVKTEVFINKEEVKIIKAKFKAKL